MGMDAIYNGIDFRFSGLLAEAAFERFPEKRETANNGGYVEFSKDEVAELIGALATKLDGLSIMNSLCEGIVPMDRVRLIHTTSFKLYQLMDWCQDADNDNKMLTFA